MEWSDLPMISLALNPPVRSASINDIITDTIDTTESLVLDDNREGARISLVYQGAKVAEIQESAYPDIALLEMSLC